MDPARAWKVEIDENFKDAVQRLEECWKYVSLSLILSSLTSRIRSITAFSMRQKRSKTYRKLLSTYILHYGFRPPFQLLLDAPFTRSLSLLHLTPEEADKRLSDVLQTSQLSKGKTKAGTPEMKCLITQCCMVELYNAEKEGQVDKDAVKIAKTWERRRCNHREAIPADECLKSVIGPNNKHRYILASDTRALRDHLRAEVAGLPLVHTNQSRIIVLEPMSDKTRAAIDEVSTQQHCGMSTHILTIPEFSCLNRSSEPNSPAVVHFLQLRIIL